MPEHAEPCREETATDGRAGDVMSELSRDTDREILAVLVAESPLHVMEIASRANRHPITVDQTCARLHERDLIRPVGRGRFAVTTDGERLSGRETDS